MEFLVIALHGKVQQSLRGRTLPISNVIDNLTYP
jgi:hypothetical protein